MTETFKEIVKGFIIGAILSTWIFGIDTNSTVKDVESKLDKLTETVVAMQEQK